MLHAKAPALANSTPLQEQCLQEQRPLHWGPVRQVKVGHLLLIVYAANQVLLLAGLRSSAQDTRLSAVFMEGTAPIPGTELMLLSPKSSKCNTMDLRYES